MLHVAPIGDQQALRPQAHNDAWQILRRGIDANCRCPRSG
jgi:hypothetical protein